MSKKLIQAAAGAGGEAVYVEDVFSTYLYEGTGATQGIVNGINLGDFGVGTSTRFDRNVDFLSRSSDLTGNADGKTFTFSCWVFLPPKVDNEQRMLYATDSSDNGFMVYVQSDNTLGLEAWNGGVRTLQAATSTVLPTNAWANIIISLDTANSSNRYIYFNDVAASVSWYTYNNANIEFTRPTHYVGIWGNGTSRGFYDDMAHMYLDYTYRDLSTASNRRIFIDANGGSTSASSLAALSPIVYLPMTTAYSVGQNEGTGGDFSVNGSPTIVENGTEYVSGSGEGGLVWTKNRNQPRSHNLVDTERGVRLRLMSNSTDGQYNEVNGLTSFNSDGYSLSTATDYNANNDTYASWTFRKQAGFFDVVTYTGDGTTTGGRTISHNLGSVPGMIIVKRTDSAGTKGWIVYHSSLGSNNYLVLNSTDSVSSNGQYYFGNGTNLVAPTSTEFTVYADAGGDMNASGGTYVAYLFAHDDQSFGDDSDESIIKCGSFTNDSASVGVEVNLGFEPQWLLIKGASSGSGLGNWALIDNMRGASVDSQQRLYANSTGAEGSSNWFKFTSQGFTPNTYFDGTLIYIAIRRPMKTPESGTEVFNDTFQYGEDGKTAGYLGSPADLDIRIDRTGGGSLVRDRLRGDLYLRTQATDAEAGSQSATWDNMTGYFYYSPGTSANTNIIHYVFKRATGFFDVVAYTGDGSATHNINHNLTVLPEMMIVKRRDSSSSGDWFVYHKDKGYDKYAFLNDGSVGFFGSTTIYNAEPTSTVFTVGNNAGVNASGSTYIWYGFATTAGVSKIGSYTGTGSNVDVDCGFSAGARFILIKRSNDGVGGAGDWYVWDSERGIVAGNDPYLLLNSTAAEVTSTDYIDPLSSGFTVTSSAPAGLNASGGTYIFLAIA